MDKDQIIAQLKKNVTDELTKLEAAYETTKNLVQKGDLKSDGKYDTRATEANYLADGQRNRISDLKQELELIDSIELMDSDTVAIGSIVDIKFNEQVRKYFVSPTAGGTMIKLADEVVLVISVFSPIGDAVVGLAKGDEFELELQEQTRSYEVINFV